MTSQNFIAKFEGEAVHAAAKPWEGVIALHASTLAYIAIRILGQLINPTLEDQ